MSLSSLIRGLRFGKSRTRSVALRKIHFGVKTLRSPSSALSVPQTVCVLLKRDALFKEKFRPFVDFEFLTEMGCWGTD